MRERTAGGAILTIATLLCLVSACGSTDSPGSGSVSSASGSASVVVERDLDQSATASSSTPSATAPKVVERGLVFGGFDDIVGGMTLAQVRSRGWTVGEPGGGDGCESFQVTRGPDRLVLTGKYKSNTVSTVSVFDQSQSDRPLTARIPTSTATFAHITAEYPDASITYTPPINRGPQGSVGTLVVSSNDFPDRSIAFGAYPAPDTQEPPADTVFTSAEAGTTSALTGGTFGCA